MTPPAKSPYRVRESFESRIAQAGPSATGSPFIPGQGPATPPSPTSTASPTMTSATTLPRPLTPAWYETKTNFASTNDVLTHYNAVMRGGSYHKQQQQPQRQQPQQQSDQQQSDDGGNKQLYYDESTIGPLDDIASASRAHNQQQPSARQDQNERFREIYSPQPRTGSADSFGVVRSRSSGRDHSPLQPHAAHLDPHGDVHRYHQQPTSQRPPQVDRHSFMMASEHLSTHSTWTGNLSDVTTTSGEVSIGAFVDRKHAGSHHRQHRRSKSGDESEVKDGDVRKSQASAYSMGSCFGVGSSSAGSRQSAGAYSNYSSNSGFGSGSIFVSGSLSTGIQPGRGDNSGGHGEPSLSPDSNPVHKQRSGSFKKRSSDHRTGHGSLNDSAGSSGSITGSSHSPGHEGGSRETLLSTAPTRMNSMRLSAFGPGDDDGDTPVPSSDDNDLTRDTHFDTQTPQELERKIQQEWMERRAAVKKDSKTRLEQLHKQQEEMDERERISQEQQQNRQHRMQQRDRQQRYLQFQMEQERREQEDQDDTAVSGEPYVLNSVYFKGSEEMLQLGAPSQSSSGTATAPSRAESTHMSITAVSLGESTISTPSTTATSGTAESSSPSPNPQFMYPSAPAPTSRPYETAASSSYSPSTAVGTQEHESEDVDRLDERQETDEELNLLMRSSASYALHRQSRNKQAKPQSPLTLQEPQAANPSLLHYDSVDSIATIRATHRYPTHSPSPTLPPLQRPSSARSGPSSPSSPSPSPMSQRPLYAQYHQAQQVYPSQPYYQQQRSQQTPSPGASISQVGPSQYRIIPDDVAQREKAGASDDGHPASRSLSPVQRTSSRLTNLTSTGSDYQWESTELNQHQWEMIGATSSTRTN